MFGFHTLNPFHFYVLTFSSALTLYVYKYAVSTPLQKLDLGKGCVSSTATSHQEEAQLF